MTPYGKRGLLVRLVYLALAFLWWHATGGGRRDRGRIVTLCYHDVRDDQVGRFEWQMKHVARRAVALGDLHAPPLGDRAGVCITFDDALDGVPRNALPVLAALGIPATVFAVTECAGRAPDWPMAPHHPDLAARTLSREAWSQIDDPPRVRVESHSATHADLSRVNEAQLREELTRSKAELQRRLGRSVTALALPYGACDERVIAAARAAGYRLVFSLRPALHDPSTSNGGESTAIGRFRVSPNMWRLEFRLTADGAYGWLCEWRRAIRQARDLILGDDDPGPAPGLAPGPAPGPTPGPTPAAEAA